MTSRRFSYFASLFAWFSSLNISRTFLSFPYYRFILIIYRIKNFRWNLLAHSLPTGLSIKLLYQVGKENSEKYDSVQCGGKIGSLIRLSQHTETWWVIFFPHCDGVRVLTCTSYFLRVGECKTDNWFYISFSYFSPFIILFFFLLPPANITADGSHMVSFPPPFVYQQHDVIETSKIYSPVGDRYF